MYAEIDTPKPCIIGHTEFSAKTLLPIFLLIGVGLRLVFFGSTPVYENDFKRYLWDGAVTASGENPYRFSPAEIFEAGEPGARSVPDLARLAIKSNTYNGIHMDVLLVAPLIAAILFASRRPIVSATLLSLAASIKIWPLLLAPVLFRQWPI